MTVGERRGLAVTVTNRDSRVWDSDPAGPAPIRATGRWLTEAGVTVITDAPRTPFPQPLPPGDSMTIELDAAAPVRPGRYTLEVDVVEEGVRWFDCPARIEVEVRASPLRHARHVMARAWSRRPTARWRRRRTHSIPRVIHRIWLGDAPMPEEHRRFGENWRRHHPDWAMRTWTDRDLPRLVPGRVVRRARSHSETSNSMRYEILRRHGGVYVDTDVDCQRSIEPLLAGVEAFAAWESPHRLGNAVLGAVPGHPVFELAALESRLTLGTSIHSVESTGPGFLTLIAADRPLLTVFDTGLFYPFRWDEDERRNDSFPGAYAVHHWAKSWHRPGYPAD
jgi:glycosyl transferase-like sugar-binding protein